jgi:DNA-binding NarL/FixJ family response regulator
MITILLADDHPIVREGLRTLFSAEPDFNIVGEATDGLAAAQLAERLQPDVLLTDLMMPNLSGLEVTRQVRRRAPQTRVIILSIHANEAYVLEALRGGASAYVLKDSRTNILLLAVREVMAGRRYLSPPLTERAIEAYMAQTKETVFDIAELLTTREREVLSLIVQGHSNTKIGEMLSISPRTADTHRTNIMRKLDVHSQADLVKFVRQHNLLPHKDKPSP